MKDWIKSSFRNRIFVTVLLVTLLPMLLCDIFIMQIAMSQSRRQLREQALEELGGIERQFDGLYDEVDSVTAGLADSIVVRSALRRGGSLAAPSRGARQPPATAPSRLRAAALRRVGWRLRGSPRR